jgi:hypothetical protein
MSSVVRDTETTTAPSDGETTRLNAGEYTIIPFESLMETDTL